MKKATQRVLSLLLAAVLLFGMFPMSAFAAEADWRSCKEQKFQNRP
jgi:hypothetical protein